MYNEEEKKKLSKATILLLKKSIKDLRDDKTLTAFTLLTLKNFASIAFNSPETCKKLIVLVMSNMWSMFYKELRK